MASYFQTRGSYCFIEDECFNFAEVVFSKPTDDFCIDRVSEKVLNALSLRYVEGEQNFLNGTEYKIVLFKYCRVRL